MMGRLVVYIDDDNDRKTMMMVMMIKIKNESGSLGAGCLMM